MRALLPIYIVVFSLLSPPGNTKAGEKAPNTPSDQSQRVGHESGPSNRGTPEAPFVITIKGNEPSQNAHSPTEKDSSSRYMVIFTFVIALSAIVQVLLYFSQNRIISKSVEQNRRSATAALRSVRAAINGQRAWITAAIEHQTSWEDIETKFERHDWAMGLALVFKNCGDTPARIMDTYIRIDVVECADINTVPRAPRLAIPPDYSKPGYRIVAQGRVLVPRQRYRHLVTINKSIFGDDFAEWRVQQRVLCVFGFVNYRDVFGKGRVTRFCFVYQISRPGGFLTNEAGDSIFPPGFVMDGPDEYNEAT